MTARPRLLVLALAVPLLVSSCGTPEPDVTAAEAQPVANETWKCPQDVALLESLQTAHGNLEGRPAASVEELEASGLLVDSVDLAATIADGAVVGTSDRCDIVTYTGLGLDERCASELDRLTIDVFTGILVKEHLDSSLGLLEQARAVGVDHGPYLAYTWNEAERRQELIDPTCPNEAEVEAAFRAAPGAEQEHVCITGRKTIETAVEAYTAKYGTPPADEQTLVADGFLRTVDSQYDLGPDGSVVAAPGSECEQFEQDAASASEPVDGSDPTQDCAAGRRTLETAVEAYRAQTGAPPADQQTLVAEGFLRNPIDEFHVLPDGTVVVVEGAGCV